MREFKTGKGEFIIVEHPKGAYNFTNMLALHQIDYEIEKGGITWDSAIILKEYWGQEFEIIGLVSEILKDEELSKKVVDQLENGMFFDYTQDFEYHSWVNSFQSLVTKHQLKESDLIIKKI